MVSARTLFCTLSPRQNTIMVRSNARGNATQEADPCKVRQQHNHVRESHVCQTLLQEPSPASLTYPSPLRRRTSTDHHHIHIGTLQTTTWRSHSFSIITRFAPLWRHRSRQSLSIHRRQISMVYKHNLFDFQIDYRSRVLRIIRCWRFAS